jgi:hypothetical protein
VYFEVMSHELHASQDSNDTALQGLEKLADEYCELSTREDSLYEVLGRLEREEAVLQTAFKEASKTGAQRLQEERREKDATKIARLEEALMESSSEEDDDEDGNAMDAHSLFSYGKTSITSTSVGKRDENGGASTTPYYFWTPTR